MQLTPSSTTVPEKGLPQMKEEDARSAIKAVARGNASALRALYFFYAPGLIRFVENRLQDPVEAADIAQETFLTVWTQAAHYEARSTVKTWLYSIARNKSIDRLRQLGRVDQLADDYDPPDASVDLQRALEAGADARNVRACIEKLGTTHRRMVQMAFYEDLSYAAISEVEGVPEGTIKTRIFHAKRLLWHCLSKVQSHGGV